MTEQELHDAIVTRAMAILMSERLDGLKKYPKFYNKAVKKGINDLADNLRKYTEAIYATFPDESMDAYCKLADDLQREFDAIAKIRFLDKETSEAPLENRYYQVEYLGKTEIAKFQNGVFWIPRNPIGIAIDKISNKGLITL